MWVNILIINWQEKEGCKDLVMFVGEWMMFVKSFSGIIDKSTPHLYLSALPFSPSNSIMARCLLNRFPGIAKVIAGQHLDVCPGSQQALLGHEEWVTTVTFSPDGRYLVSGSFDKKIQLWDAKTGSQVGNSFQGHTDWVKSVAFSPDGRQIVSGSGDKTIQVWGLQTGTQNLHQKFTLPNLFPVIYLPPVMSDDSEPDKRDNKGISKKHLMNDLYLQQDSGWIVGYNDELLLWVPSSYHPFTIHNPQQPRLVISASPMIDLSNIVHCHSWQEWFTS